MSDLREPNGIGAEPGDHPADAALAVSLRTVLADRGRTTNGDVRALLDDLAVFPARSTSGRGQLGAAAAAIAILVLGGGLVLGRLALPHVGSDGPSAADPAAFAADPRLAACEATTGPADRAFEMAHAEWFPLHFPGWWKGAPELEVPDPALVVIGKPFDGPFLGPARAEGEPTPATTRPPAILMCIAVGPPSSATLHQYGPTWFDRIVPVLSDADIARAAHLDPDVLGDPAAWPFPERLAPCGGATGNELYIFEANPLRDFARYFPSAQPVESFAVDDPAIVVVYRDPLALNRPVGWTDDPNEHDVCVVLEAENARPDHMVIQDVDTRGFRLRLDVGAAAGSPEPSASPEVTPRPTPEPSAPLLTPEPAPDWAGDARTAVECEGPARFVNLGRSNTGSGADPDQTLSNALGVVHDVDPSFPDAGFVVGADDPAARLYVRRSPPEDRVIAAITIVTARPGSTDEWVVQSAGACDESEFDPTVTTGNLPFGRWDDGTGSGTVDTTLLSATADCYSATQVLYDGRLFVRIPRGGVDPSQLETTWKADIALPSTAIDTGLRSGDLRLFRSAQGGALYVAKGDRAERLPHVIGDEVQRTDCN